MVMQKIHNILVVKLSSIGDVVHSLPFLEVLKQGFPHARIDWLVEEAASSILFEHPGIDRLILSRRKSWQKKMTTGLEFISVWHEGKRLFKDIRLRNYDLVIDLQGLFRSGMLVGISKGARKIGMTGAREFAGFFLNEPPVTVSYEQHAVDRYLEIAAYLGCDTTSWEGSIPVSESDRNAAQKLVNRNGRRTAPIVAINPGARWKTKMWLPERMASLADRIQRELSCDVVFTGSDQDRMMIDQMIDAMEKKALNLAGKTSLRELAALYDISRLLITADTGPMHIAAAMGCPVAAIFGPTDPLRTGPYGKGHCVIQEKVDCGPCFRKKCDSMICMKQITVDRCFDTVGDMLTKGTHVSMNDWREYGDK